MYEPARSPRSYQQSTVLPPHPDDLGNLSEPTPHQYVQAAHSGHSNPLYDQRQYPVGPSSCSPSGATRSPPQHCPVGQGPGPHYHTIHEGSNGGSYGLPMPSYDEQAHPLPSAHHHDYNPSPVSSAPRKGHRAQLVSVKRVSI